VKYMNSVVVSVMLAAVYAILLFFKISGASIDELVYIIVGFMFMILFGIVVTWFIFRKNISFVFVCNIALTAQLISFIFIVVFILFIEVLVL